MPGPDQHKDRKLRIAVVGGGQRCLTVLNMLESGRFQHFQAELVGVADLNPEAKGIRKAREQGIFTTADCRELFNLDPLDLVIEMTDDRELLRNLAGKNPETVRLMGHTASSLFNDIVMMNRVLEEKEDEVSLARSFNQALINATGGG